MDFDKLTQDHFYSKVKLLDKAFPNLLDAEYKQKLWDMFEKLGESDFTWAVERMIDERFLKSRNGHVEIYPPKMSFCRELAIQRNQFRFGHATNSALKIFKSGGVVFDDGKSLDKLKEKYGADSVLGIMDKMKKERGAI